MAYALLVESITLNPDHDTPEKRERAVAQLDAELHSPIDARPDATMPAPLVHVERPHTAPLVGGQVQQADDVLSPVVAPAAPIALSPDTLAALMMFNELQFTDEASERMAWEDGRPVGEPPVGA